MKSRLIFDKNDENYSLIAKIEFEKDTFLIYTKNEHSETGEVICYAGKYYFSGDEQIIQPVEDDYTLELLDGILIQLESAINKKEGSE